MTVRRNRARLDGARRDGARGDAATPRPLATVGALIVAPDGRALFVHTEKWRGLWGVPGGKIEQGETMLVALRRETREETGLSLHDVRWAPTQEAVRSDEFVRDAHFVLLNFIARTRETDVVLNDEADRHAWLRPADALRELPLNGPTRALVLHYLGQGHSGPLLHQAPAPSLAGTGAEPRRP